jgi:hypothetical protein
VLSERTVALKADVDAQAPIRVVIKFEAVEDRVGGGIEGAGLGLADEGIWLQPGLDQQWKGKPFRPAKYADEDGSITATIEVRPIDQGGEKPVPLEITEVRLVPRGIDEKPGYDCEVKRQYVQLADEQYDLLELYGQAPGEVDTLGNECVICLIEARDTAILPCRHLCLCNSCADVMRLRSQNCPICRQEIKSLLQVEGDVAAAPPAVGSNTGTPQPTPRGSLNTPRRVKPTGRHSLTNFTNFEQPVRNTPRRASTTFSAPYTTSRR